MKTLLKSVTVTDFRSIRGQVTIPLDAPIVLIHGQNGAGKTSILSAIELGLTGAVQSLDRDGVDYISYLPHKMSSSAEVKLTVDGLNGQNRTTNLIVKGHKVSGEPLLKGELIRFFIERCYLSQATLSRLLEIYQQKNAGSSDSALTIFVKDLLGLDRLEALIDGLHPAGDVRRLRSLAPLYSEAKDAIQRIESEISKLMMEKNSVDIEIADLKAKLGESIAVLHPKNSSNPSSPVSTLQIFEDDDDLKLQFIARSRRDLLASAEQWNSLQSTTMSAQRASIEKEEGETRTLLNAWNSHTGMELETIHQELKSFFPDIPSPSNGDPELARSVAKMAVEKELQRCVALLQQEATDDSRLSSLRQSIEQGKARILTLDAQIADSAGLTSGLAQSLAQLAPYIDSENCPVCDRNYSEISSRSLQEHISDRIALLTEQAGRLQAMSTDKAQTAGLILTAERECTVILNRKLDTNLRDMLKTRWARFEELKVKLENLEASAIEGVRLMRKASDALRRLNEFRSIDERSSSLRLSVGEIALLLEQPVPGVSESLELVLNRLLVFTEAQETILLKHQSVRREGRMHIEKWQSADARLTEINKEIKAKSTCLDKLKKAKKEADQRLEVAKNLATSAREKRTEIVRHVFNKKLNKLWKDLFIRLAPEEPFVPAFAIPDNTGGSVEAVLETLYRDGGKGGSPRAMLSAGNLNTAALTLFLSLHLSVKPSLPWLIIDDPVQSMDEVHISQFAALLRTLAKQHNRQIIIAVHERPLFEYLSLELSPAFQDDRLITIEVSKAADGMTIVEYEPKIYIPDRAIAA